MVIVDPRLRDALSGNFARVFLHTNVRSEVNLFTSYAERSYRFDDAVESIGVSYSFLEKVGIAPVHVFGSMSCFSALAKKEAVKTLMRGEVPRGVVRAEPVPLVRALLLHSAPMIGAPEVWSEGCTGRGVKVAVVDTGIDLNHPDLKGKVIAAKSFTPESPDDFSGHGTHVAGIIASGDDVYRGVAPGVNLINAKALNSSGGGYLDDIIAAAEWAVNTAKADVVNMSLGVLPDLLLPPLLKIFVKWGKVITDRVAKGVLYVAAAGNLGKLGEDTIELPALFPAVIAVAASDKKGRITPYSARGSPGLEEKLGWRKPDFTAPGGMVEEPPDPWSGIISSFSTQISEYYRDMYGKIAVDRYHISMCGTSMASPHVAGAIAILVEASKKEGYKPEEYYPVIYGALANTARDLGEPVYVQGHGMVEVDRAVEVLGKYEAPLPPPPKEDLFGETLNVVAGKLLKASSLTRGEVTTPETTSTPIPAILGLLASVGIVAIAALPFLALLGGREEVPDYAGELRRRLEAVKLAYRLGLISDSEYERMRREIVEDARRILAKLLRGSS